MFAWEWVLTAAATAAALAHGLVLPSSGFEGRPLVRVKRIVGGRAALPPPVDDPSVYVKETDAWIRGVREKDYYAFLGIRYAEPPVGKLRFQRPRRVAPEGELDATKPGPPCPQPNTKGRGVIGSEDCLFLNVFTPTLLGDIEGLPVLVWIHGGGFRRGSANQYGVSPLLRQRLVVVTIQYRLGSLGFLSAASKELPGNVGMFDMAASLAWVNNYIGAFGGDPKRVTVFGQGTGASSAILLSLSQITKGFISGVLAMSGTALSSFALDHDPLGTTRDLAARNNCPMTPVLELVRCLQEVPVERLVEADSGLQELKLKAQGLLAGLTGLLGAAPVVEGEDDGRGLPNFLTRPPLDLLKGGELPLVPIITGVTSQETSSAIYGDYKKEIAHNIATVPGYVDNILGGLIVCAAPLIGNMTGNLLHTLAANYFSFLTIKDTPQAFSQLVEVTGDALFHLPAFQTAQWWSKKAPLYLYIFEHQGPNKGGSNFLHGLPLVQQSNDPPPATAGVGHGDDLPYVFDAKPLDPDSNKSEDSIVLNEQDLSVQGHVTDFIAEFARSGVPAIRTASGKVPWPAFTPGNGNHMRISTVPHTSSDFHTCQMELWTGALQTMGLSTVLCRTMDTLGSVSTGSLGVNPVSKAAAIADSTDILTIGEEIPILPKNVIPLKPLPKFIG